jgi:hypothetical protein
MAGSNNGVLLLGGIGLLAYLTRDSWLPTVEADFPSVAALLNPTGATGNSPLAPTTSTANQPISAAIPGATPVGTDGCYEYQTGTDGSSVINCPPGVSPPAAAAPANNCQAGFTLDAAGVCTMYPDAVLLAQLNTLPWSGLSNIPAEQIARIDPQILAMYSTTTGVNAGTVLAYILGLGANPTDGTVMNGSDGNVYKALGGVFYRQGTQTLTTMPAGLATTAALASPFQRGNPFAAGTALQGVGRIGRLGTVSDVAAALPITNATLIAASCNPQIAALVGRNPAAMLTASQWNAFYTQCTGIVQGIPLHDPDMIGALMSAEQYQARRAAAGLQTVSNLGTLRPARRGAFPLGRVGLINQWVPPVNRTIYQVPGRGAVPAGRGNRIPRRMGLISDGGGDHRSARSPFPRPSWWREAE